MSNAPLSKKQYSCLKSVGPELRGCGQTFDSWEALKAHESEAHPTSKEYLGLDRDELRAVVRERDAEIERLRAALSALLTRYVDLVNCGDCGNWDPEKEREVIAARGALSGDSPTETRKPCSICGSTEHSHLHCYGPVHETKARRSTEGLIFDGADGITRPVKPIVGTDKAISDDDLRWMIRMETESKYHRAFVELWERRGSPEETSACDCPEVCKVCGGRAKACALLGHRTEGERYVKWHKCAPKASTDECSKGGEHYWHTDGYCVKCEQPENGRADGV